ncbi:MAG TPA: tRNA pseudouridine(55) synthase TruB [Candidatus Omnitrophica bacterium]|nr:tRNA pseudouridine(55) synthase TruB [Candidatus Omnitrophota bacterium]
MKDGILIIDKPKGVTSHDVVDMARKILKTKKVGHSGTLDPVATGVLVLLVGRATKLFSEFVHFDKEYEATLRLGVVTSTGDSEGKVISEKDMTHITEDDVRNVFGEFIGEREQVPPMVSAIKHKGKRLYELARKGIEVERAARPIKIYDLRITRMALPDIDFYVRCSKGTYIRRLGEEIGEKLGVGGFISRIRRISLGPFDVRDSMKIEDVHEGCLRAWKPN